MSCRLNFLFLVMLSFAAARTVFADSPVSSNQAEPDIVWELRFDGGEILTERELRRGSAIRIGETVTPELLERAEHALTQLFREEGFPQTQVKLDVVTLLDGLKRLDFIIDTGAPARIADVRLATPLPADLLFLEDRLRSQFTGLRASESNLHSVPKEFVIYVRKEGYLQARARLKEILWSTDRQEAELILDTTLGTPATFIFYGNTIFSTEELLSPLRLETRTVPFSANAISTLTREIVKLYESHGYFFAQVESDEPRVAEGRQIFQVRIEEGRFYRLRDIHLSGNSFLQESEILDLLSTKPASLWPARIWYPGFVGREDVENDLTRLEDYYRDRGYREVTTSYEITEVSDDRLELRIYIIEGPRSQIHSVKIVWNDGAEIPSIQSFLREGDPFDRDSIEADRLRLAREIANQGNPVVAVQALVDEATNDVVFSITPGPKVKAGTISIAGNRFTQEYVVRRELTVETGKLVRAEDVRKSEQNLYQSGLFQRVRIEPSDGDLNSDTEDLTVSLLERDTGVLAFGAGFDTDDGLHLSGELSQRNLYGTGNTLLFGLDSYFQTGGKVFDAGIARVAFTRPHIFGGDRELVSEIYAQSDVELLEQFNRDRLGAVFTLRDIIDEQIKNSLILTGFKEDLTDVDTDIIIGEADVGKTSYTMIEGELDYDNRDDIFNPRRGYRSVLHAKVSSDVLGSEEEFAGFTAHQSVFFTLSPSFVWANNARYDLLHPFGESDTIPLGQRIFLGGRRSLRGYGVGEVGPRGTEGNIAGGDRAFVLNTELQYEFYPEMISVIFLDAGQAKLVNEGDFEGDPRRLSDLRYTPGLGFRYRTPIGPLSVEYGWVLDPEPEDSSGRFNVVIGGTF